MSAAQVIQGAAVQHDGATEKIRQRFASYYDQFMGQFNDDNQDDGVNDEYLDARTLRLLGKKAMSLGVPDILVEAKGGTPNQWLLHKSVLVKCPAFAKHFQNNPGVPRPILPFRLDCTMVKTLILYLYTGRFEAPNPLVLRQTYPLWLYELIDFTDIELNLPNFIDLAIKHIEVSRSSTMLSYAALIAKSPLSSCISTKMTASEIQLLSSVSSTEYSRAAVRNWLPF